MICYLVFQYELINSGMKLTENSLGRIIFRLNVIKKDKTLIKFIETLLI